MTPSELPARIRSMPRRRRKKAVIPWVEREIARSAPASGAGGRSAQAATITDAHGIRVVHVTLSPALNQFIQATIMRRKANSLAMWGAR